MRCYAQEARHKKVHVFIILFLLIKIYLPRNIQNVNRKADGEVFVLFLFFNYQEVLT